MENPIKGPRIIWNKKEIKRAVELWGMKGAIERFSKGEFEPSYVEGIFKKVFNKLDK